MIEREFIMSLLGLKSNLIIIDENVNLDPNDNSNNKLAYDSNPPSIIEELSEDDLKRKVIELDNNTSTILVETEYMTIDVASDKVIYKDDFTMLVNEFSSLPKLVDSIDNNK